MTYITIHHSEFVGKCYSCEQSRVYFSVTRNSVSVNNLLEGSCKIIKFKVSWWLVSLTFEIILTTSDVHVHTSYVVFELLYMLLRNKDLSFENFFAINHSVGS